MRTDNGYFNMTNPASMVFHRENDLQLFERVKIDDEENLKRFIERGQPRWKLPVIQVILNWVSLAIFLTIIGSIFLPAVLGWINRKRQKQA